MRAGTFLDIVGEVGGMTREEAEAAARATLHTLAERVTRGEADDVAAFLPRELRDVMDSVPEPAEPFGLGEFVRRVAERLGVDERSAYRRAHAVFVALGQAVPPGELEDLAAQLPKEFNPLLGRARGGSRDIRRDPLARRVAELASLDLPTAKRAVEAVLQTLAVRLSEGEVDDLVDRLSADWMPALERGLAESRNATRMSVDEFLARVAKLEDVPLAEAERHARAVFTALRELLPEKELHDVESELPAEYAPLFSGIV